jgi:peptidylprolyl isomerase
MRLLPLVLVLAACSSSASAPPPTDASITDAVTAADVATAADVITAADRVAVADAPAGAFTAVALRSDAPERAFTEPEMVLVAGQDYRAVMETDVGRIVLDLYEDRTPLAVNSFVFLALHRYFDGLAFHRVLEGFVAQGGDPLTAMEPRTRWGTGGPGYNFDTETFDDLTFGAAGTLGMARSQSRASNGSQFFITLAATANLNGQYTVFGRVTEGSDVLPRIARNATMTAPPMVPTRMTTVRIESRAR